MPEANARVFVRDPFGPEVARVLLGQTRVCTRRCILTEPQFCYFPKLKSYNTKPYLNCPV